MKNEFYKLTILYNEDERNHDDLNSYYYARSQRKTRDYIFTDADLAYKKVQEICENGSFTESLDTISEIKIESATVGKKGILGPCWEDLDNVYDDHRIEITIKIGNNFNNSSYNRDYNHRKRHIIGAKLLNRFFGFDMRGLFNQEQCTEDEVGDEIDRLKSVSKWVMKKTNPKIELDPRKVFKKKD